MAYISKKLVIKTVFSSLLIVSIFLFGYSPANADASISEKNNIRNQISAYRANFRWCGWNPHLPNFFANVELSEGANVVAQKLADDLAGGIPINYDFKLLLDDQLDQNNANPALNAKWFDFVGQNYSQALTHWINAINPCNAIMSTGGMANIGIGKSSLGNGNFYWTLLINEEGIIDKEDDDPVISNSYTTNSGGDAEVTQMFLFLPQQNDGNPPFSLASNDKPDLVITELSQVGNINKSDANNYHVKIRVTIENQGTNNTGKFNVGILASTGPNSLEIPVPFAASNFQSDAWTPIINSPIVPGESRVIEGELFFHPSLKGKTIQVLAVADACSEGNSCAVNEIDESNNQSIALSMDLSVPNTNKKFSPIKFGNGMLDQRSLRR